jgi:hypothetical protein
MATTDKEPPHPRTVVHAGAGDEYVAVALICIPERREWQAVSIRVKGGKVVDQVPLGEPEDLSWSLMRGQEGLRWAAAEAQQVPFPPSAKVMLAKLPEVLG